MVGTQTAQPEYILGHAQNELDRLIQQGRYYGDLTAQVLKQAGIEPGMHVLDVGCGPGDVSFVTASLVGSTGFVTGIDRSPEAVEAARKRAQGAGLTNIRFEVGDITELTLDEPVDALVGRLILMYLSSAADTLRHLLQFVKPGGIIAFQEFDLASVTSEPYCDLPETIMQQIIQTFERAGLETRCGLKLRRIFQDAGLPAPDMLQCARVDGGPDSGAYDYLQQTVRTLLPIMERTGVATAAEIDVDTLADRVRAEVLARDATIVTPPMIGAWTRNPPA